jgi:hypothetical protein
MAEVKTDHPAFGGGTTGGGGVPAQKGGYLGGITEFRPEQHRPAESLGQWANFFPPAGHMIQGGLADAGRVLGAPFGASVPSEWPSFVGDMATMVDEGVKTFHPDSPISPAQALFNVFGGPHGSFPTLTLGAPLVAKGFKGKVKSSKPAPADPMAGMKKSAAEYQPMADNAAQLNLIDGLFQNRRVQSALEAEPPPTNGFYIESPFHEGPAPLHNKTVTGIPHTNSPPFLIKTHRRDGGPSQGTTASNPPPSPNLGSTTVSPDFHVSGTLRSALDQARKELDRLGGESPPSGQVMFPGEAWWPMAGKDYGTFPIDPSLWKANPAAKAKGKKDLEPGTEAFGGYFTPEMMDALNVPEGQANIIPHRFFNKEYEYQAPSGAKPSDGKITITLDDLAKVDEAAKPPSTASKGTESAWGPKNTKAHMDAEAPLTEKQFKEAYQGMEVPQTHGAQLRKMYHGWVRGLHKDGIIKAIESDPNTGFVKHRQTPAVDSAVMQNVHGPHLDNFVQDFSGLLRTQTKKGESPLTTQAKEFLPEWSNATKAQQKAAETAAFKKHWLPQLESPTWKADRRRSLNIPVTEKYHSRLGPQHYNPNLGGLDFFYPNTKAAPPDLGIPQWQNPHQPKNPFYFPSKLPPNN